MKNILIVAPFMPSDNPRQAGHRLLSDLIVKKTKTNNVYFLGLLRDDKFNDCFLIDRIGKSRINIIQHSRIWYLFQSIFFAFQFYPRFSTRFSLDSIAKIQQICSDNNINIIRFEFSQTFFLIPYLRKKFPRVEIHASVHDLQIQVCSRKSFFERILLGWVFLTERKLLSFADVIYCLSNKDSNLLRDLFNFNCSIEVSKPKLPEFVLRARHDRGFVKQEANSILFWGAMQRVENINAVLWFVENVFNILINNGYFYKLYVVGSDPPSSILNLQSNFIEVTGFLSDPSEYFIKCKYGVVPLQMGAGVKLKTLEMLEAGLEVVSTKIGAEGIDCTDDNKLNILDEGDFIDFFKKSFSNN